MQSEKLDILADKRKQSGQLLKFITIYCRNHRMVSYDLRELPLDAVETIGNEVADLFADRFQQLRKRTSPKPGASNDTGQSGCRDRSRG